MKQQELLDFVGRAQKAQRAADELARVTSSIGDLVWGFMRTVDGRPGRRFKMDELVRYVQARKRDTAADSPQRILRQMRHRGSVVLKWRSRGVWQLVALRAERRGPALPQSQIAKMRERLAYHEDQAATLRKAIAEMEGANAKKRR